MTSVVQPYAWVGLKLPSENVRNISLGKYGTFPSNLIIHRPYHFTYELQDKLPGENFCRLRVIPPAELYADVLADEAATPAAVASASAPLSPPSRPGGSATPVDEIMDEVAEDYLGSEPYDAVEYSVVDMESQAVIARSNRANLDAGDGGGAGSTHGRGSARQMLTSEEIEALKREGTASGRDLVAKLLLSHAALDQKTTFSLAKYKLLKTKKYVRRFTVLPMDVCTLGNWLLDDKDVGSKIMELRDEMVALLGCWANVHYGGADRFLEPLAPPAPPATATATATPLEPTTTTTTTTPTTDGAEQRQQPVPAADDTSQEPPTPIPAADLAAQLGSGRWLVVDDTGGLLIAAMADRMGILYDYPKIDDSQLENGDGSQALKLEEETVHNQETDAVATAAGETTRPRTAAIHTNHKGGEALDPQQQQQQQQTNPTRPLPRSSAKRPSDDFNVRFSLNNTLTLLHTNSQANLTYLKYFGYDNTDPDHPPHPLTDHLLCLSWFQLLAPQSDTVYAQPPPVEPADVVAAWKPARRGNYHRKRRRWARTHHVVDTTRAGGFSGLVVATTLDLVSTLRHTLPLLANGAAVAVYSPSLEPLTRLADCFSVARRTAWAGTDAPGGAADAQGESAASLEQWPGTEEFPLNPMLLLGVTVQTSRARKWQVLPGRTHPLMTARGGAEGYILTGWKAKPVEGRVTARGKFKKQKTGGEAASGNA
ncbi:eukaryotic translation initiation factor gamma [Niveomyces insectorum RCEF 264]|uniref:tRNA (adenine(58)-N(1))-methyltransferase non-catalytic subunit TRM6 n=1 Tax=Niveomyces insectorum RCEF 264 TaxID=1081102 RepID=A0A167QE79_9HYPO|nr:eukaryotic translation initiation factor gamma [Niveomyces insectorum RCEF 264]